MNSQAEILEELKKLPKDGFDVHTIPNAWYSPRTMFNALGTETARQIAKEYPEVGCVRVSLKYGMIELHPEGDKITIKCYCFFGGNPEKGSYSLDELVAAIVSLKDHECPPWPG